MGVVVAATHEQLDQRVALKFLLPEAAKQPEVVQRFLREARAAVKIHSEHVARVIDVGALESGMPYMVMEYLEGEDLDHLVAGRGPLPVEEAATYVLQACEAVAEAHALGIVHRDIKPANLFLARRPSGPATIKVLDFGISKVPLTAREVSLTSTAAMMGSPGYMSPEQIMSSSEVDARSDIWSFGVVLYELLTRELPFMADQVPALIGAILHKPHVPLRAVRPELPPGIEAVVDRCLEKDPARRYANIAELAQALVPFTAPRSRAVSLERIEHVLGVTDANPALARTAIHASVDRPAARAVSSSAIAEAPLPVRSRRGVVVLVALLAVAAVGGGLLVARRGRDAADVPAAPPAATAVVAASPTAQAPPSATLEPLPPGSTAPASSSPPPLPSSSGPLRPAWARTSPGPAPVPTTHPATSPTPAPTPAAAPTCQITSYFDAEGNKHFKKECP
jgi:serine/threonine-protein kinase